MDSPQSSSGENEIDLEPVMKKSCVRANVPDMESCVRAVEKLLEYKFKRVELLEQALTMFTESFVRLKLLGDAALGLGVSNYLFSTYPNLNDERKFSLLHSVNISYEKLAREAVKRGLRRYVHSRYEMDFDDFVMGVEQEDEFELYGGRLIKPPEFVRDEFYKYFTKVPEETLANVVQSVSAAVYIDCDFDLKASWPIFERLLEPMVTLDLLQKQPPHMITLFNICKDLGKQPKIIYWKEGEKHLANVFVDGKLMASVSSKQKEKAKYAATLAAMRELIDRNAMMLCQGVSEFNSSGEVVDAKQKLHDMCEKNNWQKPCYYRTEEVIVPAHDRRFRCSVRIETETKEISARGEEKSTLSDAENNAASMVIHDLITYKYSKDFMFPDAQKQPLCVKTKVKVHTYDPPTPT